MTSQNVFCEKGLLPQSLRHMQCSQHYDRFIIHPWKKNTSHICFTRQVPRRGMSKIFAWWRSSTETLQINVLLQVRQCAGVCLQLLSHYLTQRPRKQPVIQSWHITWSQVYCMSLVCGNLIQLNFIWACVLCEININWKDDKNWCWNKIFSTRQDHKFALVAIVR